MRSENKLGLTNVADLDRAEERISKKKRLCFLKTECSIN